MTKSGSAAGPLGLWGRGRGLRSDQVRTVTVSVDWIMRQEAFRRGVEDRRAGLALRYRKDDELHWEYERGRQWASLAPVDMPLRVGGRIDPKALALYKAAKKRGYIL